MTADAPGSSDAGPGRLTLLLTTPRVAGGLLTFDAWAALSRASHLLAADPDSPQSRGITDAGMPVARLPGPDPADPAATARELVRLARAAEVVWVVSADGDPGLTDAIATEVTRLESSPPVELLVGSYDVSGARLLDLVAVMDRLRSPGGCPWDAAQTPQSLVPYLVEETYELVEAIESGDRDHVVEELGDLLLQVAFQARVGADDPVAPFDIDDVAAGIVAKLVRRHPHVFGEVVADSADQVAHNWEEIKAVEKAEGVTRTGEGPASPLDGIPAALPALARAEKVIGRLTRSGDGDLVDAAAAGDDLGGRLLALVVSARATGVDPEAALRAVLRDMQARLEARSGGATGGD